MILLVVLVTYHIDEDLTVVRIQFMLAAFDDHSGVIGGFSEIFVFLVRRSAAYSFTGHIEIYSGKNAFHRGFRYV